MRAVSTAIVVAIALLSASATLAAASYQSLSSWQRPISRVLTLLNDMSKQIAKEGRQDDVVYDELVCWCQSNTKEKADTIAEANQQIDALTSAIEEYTAKSAQLGTELEQAMKDVSETQEAMSKANEMREKESGQFQTEETSSTESIGALKSAVTAFSNAHGDGADSAARDVALPQDLFFQVKQVFKKHPRVHVDNGIKLQPTSFLQQAVSTDSYAPQDSAVFGILKQMKETFETNSVNGRTEEAQARSDYISMKKAKSRELLASQKIIRQKESDKATADQGRTQSKEDLKAMRKQLATDTEFLRTVQLTCEQSGKEYETRKTSRSNELKAIGDTVEILTNDEAQESFVETSTFLQTEQRASEGAQVRARRRAAAEALSRVAMLARQPKFSMLANRARHDSLAKVRESIETMMQQLKVVQNDEVMQRDLCVDELNQNDRDIVGKTTQKEDIEGSVADLSAKLSTLAGDIDFLKKQIFHSQAQIKKVTTVREQESQDFQRTVSDQRATQAILSKAVERLKAVYSRDDSFIQDYQTPPEQGSQHNNGNGQSVVYMIENIIANSKELEAEAKESEKDAQEGYETFLSDCSQSIEGASRMIAAKTGEAAGVDQAKVEATNDLVKVGEDLGTLESTKANLVGECEYLLKNFEERQTKRADEINGLLEARTILSSQR